EAGSGWIDGEFCARRRFPDASIQRPRCRRVAILQKEIHRYGIELARLVGPDQRSNFRGERTDLRVQPVVDGFDAEGISRDDEPTLLAVPDRQAEHFIQAVQDAVTPFLVSVDDDLGVRARPEGVTARFELCSNLTEVIDLTVENHPDMLLQVAHRLMSGGEVDDRE